MSNQFHSIDYNYLRPSVDVLRNTSLDVYSPDGNKRQIYYDVKLSDDETQKIGLFLDNLYKKKVILPDWWTQGDSLRYLWRNQFNTKKATDQVMKHIDWTNSLKKFKLTDMGAAMLVNGNVYIQGRDNLNYPILIIKLSAELKLDEATIKSLYNAIVFCLIIIKKYMMLPHYCEKFNVLINLCEQSWWKLSTTHIIKNWTSLLYDNFNGQLNTVWIYNYSKSFSFFWSLSTTFVKRENLENIIFVKKGQEKIFQQTISKKELEQCYNGTFDEIVDTYWPPHITIVDIISRELIYEEDLNTFWIVNPYFDGKLFEVERIEYEDEPRFEDSMIDKTLKERVDSSQYLGDNYRRKNPYDKKSMGGKSWIDQICCRADRMNQKVEQERMLVDINDERKSNSKKNQARIKRNSTRGIFKK